MKRQIIQPRTLRGFADILPDVGQYRRRMLRVYCASGEVTVSRIFQPLAWASSITGSYSLQW